MVVPAYYEKKLMKHSFIQRLAFKYISKISYSTQGNNFNIYGVLSS